MGAVFLGGGVNVLQRQINFYLDHWLDRRSGFVRSVCHRCAVSVPYALIQSAILWAFLIPFAFASVRAICCGK